MQTSWRALSAGLGLIVSVAAASPPVAADDDQANRETIVVVGTRVANRSALDTAVPVDVVSLGEITTTGYTELNQALSYALPSFNFPLPSITDGTDHVRPATLRGLGPDQTLVLVNSKRRHTSALVNINGSVGRGSTAVDLNTIPSAAISSVQVLRDGASAQYGSDAIAGVIDVLLREADSGGAVTAQFSQYNTDIPLAVGERDGVTDGDTLTLSGWFGLPLGQDGFLTLSGEYRDADPTNRAGFDPRQNYPEIAPGVPDPREATFNRLDHRFGNPKFESTTVFANAGYDLNPDAELYGFASFQHREGDSAGFYRRALDSRNVIAVHPDGFLPVITTDVDDASLGAGVRGNAFDWDYDASVVYGQNQLDYGVENSLNASLGAATPTSFNAGGLESAQTTVNFDVVRAFVTDYFDGPLNVAAGIEYRLEEFQINAGEEASYIDADGPGDGVGGSQVFPGFQPSNVIDEDRDSIGAYVDLEANVTERLLLSIAARAEDYSDFGESFTGKVAARYDFTDDFAVRGAISTGFRAPSLQQSFFTTTSTNFINAMPFEVGTFPATSAVATALGGKALDAEESVNYSLGAVFTAGDFNLTIDGYYIEIEDRIVLSENLTGPEVEALLTNAGIDTVNSARFFINGVDTETKGVDIVANYSYDAGDWGDFDFTAGVNFTNTDVTKTPGLEPLPGVVVFGRRETARFEEGQPDSKLTLSANWRKDRWGGFVRTTRFGETIDPGTTAANDEKIDAAWVVDAEASFELTDNVRLAVGANNLFDEYPNTAEPGPTFNEIFPFSSFSPFGFNGRLLYLKASYDW